jgi:hypothetical protein
MALALVILSAAVLGCGSSKSGIGQVSNPGIDRILEATTKHDAGEALRDHGSVKAEEVQYIYEATSSSSENRRRNAARLLITTIKGNAVELQHKALMETKDVVVWAILLDELLEKEPELAGKRPDMIKEALAEKDPDTLAVGLRAGALSNYPGIRELARKYLDHTDGKVRAAAVSGLLPDDIRELLPRLTDMIAKEKDEDTFISLAKSLIRTNDANAAAVVIKALETNTTLGLGVFNDLVFTVPDAATDKFLFVLARSNSPQRAEGFSVLSRQVWANHREPFVALVTLCVEEIQKATLSTDPRRKPPASDAQDNCEELLSFMNKQEPDRRFRGAHPRRRRRGVCEKVVKRARWLTSRPRKFRVHYE